MFDGGSNDSPIGVSAVEEIPSPTGSVRTGPPSLSVTLLGGLDTLGVLVIWPSSCLYVDGQDPPLDDPNAPDADADADVAWDWSFDDKLQVSRAARSLALALSMDNELASSRIANEKFRLSLADGMHQVKSPLQALRTFGKLLQRQLAEPAPSSTGGGDESGGRRRKRGAMKLAEDIMSQGERVIDLIEPMDALIRSDIGEGGRYLLRGDVKELPRLLPLRLPSWDDDAVAQAAANGQIAPYLELPPSMPILGDFEFEMIFPQDVLGSTVYAFQMISRGVGINLDAVGFEPDNPDLPGVHVCAKHLTEAVSNLLDNAVKYAPLRRVSGGKPSEKVARRPRNPQIIVTLVSNELPLPPGATLYIEDNGPGVPTLERYNVFARGYRGRAVQDEVGGSGLGLAISREIIIRMGGVLDIVDEGPNKLDGMTARVILFRNPEIPIQK